MKRKYKEKIKRNEKWRKIKNKLKINKLFLIIALNLFLFILPH